MLTQQLFDCSKLGYVPFLSFLPIDLGLLQGTIILPFLSGAFCRALSSCLSYLGPSAGHYHLAFLLIWGLLQGIIILLFRLSGAFCRALSSCFSNYLGPSAEHYHLAFLTIWGLLQSIIILLF